MARRVFVIGVGMTKFERPGARDWDYPDMGKEAITKALADAGIPYTAIEQAACGYVYGDSTCGQRVLYEVGVTGIPAYNVNNNCSTGSTALFVAKQFIQGGNDCVLAFGFEKMEKGSLGAKFQDRTNPLDKHVGVMAETHGITKAPFAPQMFGNAGREHMKLYGTTLTHFAKIAEKNHRHSVNNPYSQFQDVYTVEQILKSKTVHEPLTMLQCCPTSDGAGAAILCSEQFVYKYGLQSKAIEIVGMSMATDLKSSFEEASMIKAVGFDMTKKASSEAYAQAGIGPNDVQVIELHDCFSANELLTYEGLGLCPVGKAGELIDRGDNTYGGKWVVNPSGGLISKGHPLGATGLAQCAELCWQLRGLAEKRQVANAKYALQHNLGLGGAAVVTIYKKPEFKTGAQATVTITGKDKQEVLKTDTLNANSSSTSAAPVTDPTPAPVPPTAPAAAPARSPAPASSSSSSFKCSPVFSELSKRASPDLVKKVNVVYRFDVTPDAGGSIASWVVDLKNGSGKVAESNSNEKADCVISLKDSDLVALLTGKLNAQKAFMSGKLKIKGNVMLAQKLSLLMAGSAKL